MNFSLGMSEDFLSFAKLQESDLLPKQLSSHLASIGCSVNKFVGIEGHMPVYQGSPTAR